MTLIKYIVINNRIIPKTMKYWWCECINLQQIYNIENIDTSNVQDMSGLFWGCEQLEDINLKNFDTSNVTNIEFMFTCCEKLKYIV